MTTILSISPQSLCDSRPSKHPLTAISCVTKISIFQWIGFHPLWSTSYSNFGRLVALISNFSLQLPTYPPQARAHFIGSLTRLFTLPVISVDENQKHTQSVNIQTATTNCQTHKDPYPLPLRKSLRIPFARDNRRKIVSGRAAENADHEKG